MAAVRGVSRILGRWQVETVRASTQALHQLTPPTEPMPVAVINQPTDGALVLGSTQSVAVVDSAAVEAAGIEVVRRRSGGGALLVAPGVQIWIDFWIPAGDRLWSDDVVQAGLPVGEAWAEALSTNDPRAGVLSAKDGGFVVHRAGVPTDADPLARLVCFAGRGPGEVFAVDGAKVVGISQRRTRDWIRVQSMAYRRWDAAATVALLALTDVERAAAGARLASMVMAVGDRDVTDRVVLALP